jgi:hypothetical protein
MHLDEEQIQRLLHGELLPASAGSAREHLRTCADCALRMSAATADETFVLDRLRLLDHPRPSLDAASAMVGRRRGPRWFRWAAGIVLTLGAAGAAYAIPGSPVRRLVDRIAARTTTAPAARPAEPRQPTDSVIAGIAVSPGDRLTIVFSSEQPRAVATVSLTDGVDVVVRAVGGHAAFASHVDRLSISNQARSARFEVEIPRGAAHVDIEVAGQRVFAKQGSRVVIEGRPAAGDRFRVPLSGRPH